MESGLAFPAGGAGSLIFREPPSEIVKFRRTGDGAMPYGRTGAGGRVVNSRKKSREVWHLEMGFSVVEQGTLENPGKTGSNCITGSDKAIPIVSEHLCNVTQFGGVLRSLLQKTCPSGGRSAPRAILVIMWENLAHEWWVLF